MRFSCFAAATAALLLSACETVPGAAPGPASANFPATPLELGDWRRASEGAVGQHFGRQVANRYTLGAPLTAISADLRRNDFSCVANRDTAGRGDPPDQICRRIVTSENCTHTWQVHLFDAQAAGALGRARALYDRSCGGDGLLGGPG